MAIYSFDVAIIPANLKKDGHRDISNPTWGRMTIEADRLIDAHLWAALMGSCHGMVIEVLYRE